MRPIIFIIISVTAVFLGGCASEPADNTAETKPAEVKLNMSDQQKADIADKFKNTDWKKK